MVAKSVLIMLINLGIARLRINVSKVTAIIADMVKVRVMSMCAPVRSLTPHRGCFYQTKPNSAPLDSPGWSTERAQLRNEAKSCAAVQPVGGALQGRNYQTKPNFPPLASHRRGR